MRRHVRLDGHVCGVADMRRSVFLSFPGYVTRGHQRRRRAAAAVRPAPIGRPYHFAGTRAHNVRSPHPRIFITLNYWYWHEFRVNNPQCEGCLCKTYWFPSVSLRTSTIRGSDRVAHSGSSSKRMTQSVHHCVRAAACCPKAYSTTTRSFLQTL